MSAPPVIVYVAGSGRSGSTLLAAVLGQADGWFAAGEVRYLWTRGLREGRRCGCGEPVPACPVWRDVLTCAFGPAGPDVGEAIARQSAIDGMRRVPRPFLGRASRRRLAGDLDDHPRTLERLYRAMGEVTGARVVVDSSKLPTYGWILSDLTTLDLRVVHLVRDPRAAAYSWQRTKTRDDDRDGAPMHRMAPPRSAALWSALNAAAARRWSPAAAHNLRLRYEDLVAEPRAAVRRIAALAGDADAVVPFVGDRSVALAPTHTVAGNPDRLRSGEVPIRPDEAWRGGLARRDRWVVSAITAPVRPFLGY